WATSNPFTSPAICVENALASNLVMRAMPERPALIASQEADKPIPTGEMMPRPVTTTLRLLTLCLQPRRLGETEPYGVSWGCGSIRRSPGRTQEPARGGKRGCRQALTCELT